MDLHDHNGLTEAEFLRQYRPGEFERPSVAADMVVFTVAGTGTENTRRLPEKELRVLLIRRGGHPYLGCWALPGGFVRPEETAGQAAERELREETGVEGFYLEQLYTFSEPDRDPRTRVMSCAHMALIDSSAVQVRAGDDADRACWFQISYRLLREERDTLPDGFQKLRRYRLELTHGDTCLSAQVEHRRRTARTGGGDVFAVAEAGGLAFDHAKIIACAMERLRSKVAYTDLALHLMPEYFTLGELQQVYEVILGKKLLSAAFRRKAARLVRETDRFTEGGAHRPSRLFQRNWEED